MPKCYVSNCPSRTYTGNKLKYFYVPTEKGIRQKWLEACQIGTSVDIKQVRVCQQHFTDECFENKWTNLQYKNKKKKLVVKLKSDAVPTKQLNCKRKLRNKASIKPKARRWTKACGREKNLVENPEYLRKSVSVCGLHFETPIVLNDLKNRLQPVPKPTIFPSTAGPSSDHSYCSFVPNTVCSDNEIATVPRSIDISPDKEKHEQLKKPQEQVDKLTALSTPEVAAHVPYRVEISSEVEKDEKLKRLQEQVDTLTAEKKKLLVTLKEKSQLLLQVEKDKKKDSLKLTTDALSKVFTPGQIKKLLMPHDRRIQWYPEDIAAAVDLHSLSPKAYQYLRDVRHMPLPSEATLRNWCNIYHVELKSLNDE